MNKKRYQIISKETLANDIVSMWIKAPDITDTAAAGQFVSVYCDDKSALLPRPISICDTDGNGGLRLVFKIVGKGTLELSKKNTGDGLDILGPLGNGFGMAFDKIAGMDNPDIAFIGGGVGIPPMLISAKSVNGRKNIILGYRDTVFMNEDFDGYGNVYIATENGSAGVKGNVIDCLIENKLHPDIILACGPLPMLKGIKKYAEENNITAFVSLEEKMACGIGACLACVCKTNETDSHSMVKNKRICKDGPVFDVKEVDFT
ncbi:MAG: dihydroorotate dehydrogenase electron transfer subunit [Lachnospiraceae bacterium]|nr:dihydroorotate dehydrogenase electron transfer subunit [Lachnospiraceae bacterium]